MRIMGFTKKWAKLDNPEFTTFRVTRKDTDWYIGEQVQIVFRPRTKEREPLGNAEIISKETKTLVEIRNAEAIADGFPEGKVEMWRWMFKSHKSIRLHDMINKLTLKWITPNPSGEV